MKLLLNKFLFIRTLFIFTLVMFFIFVSSPLLAQEVGALPNSEQSVRIDLAADFLEEMGYTDIANNVREWLRRGKIKIVTGSGPDGTTTPKGEIFIREDFTGRWSTDSYDRFVEQATLASILLHEKVHAHQAPGVGDLAEGILPGDWAASSDVYKECVGPEATEVDAYYKQILALLRWANKIKDTPIPGNLNDADRLQSEQLKADKIDWLIYQAGEYATRLKSLNFEKMNRVSGGKYLLDLMEEIVNRGLSDEDRLGELLKLLEGLVDNLLKDDGPYKRARDLYSNKRGNKTETGLILPGDEGVLRLPEEYGYAAFYHPLGLDLFEAAEALEIEISSFEVPPLADPGYEIISPVFEVIWNAVEPVEFSLNLMNNGEHDWNDAILMTFAPFKDYSENSWVPVDNQELLTELDFVMGLSASVDPTGFYALIIPNPTFRDLSENHWSYNIVENLVSKNIIDKNNKFEAEKSVTRSQLVRYLVRTLELPLIEKLLPFEDVPLTHPDYLYISTAYYNGLTQGITETSFAPEAILTREQSITFMIRGKGLESITIDMNPNEIDEILLQFVDNEFGISQWAKPYVAMAVKENLVEGYPDNTMQGYRQLTHSEVSAILYRIMVESFFDFFSS